jgi:peptidoglycan-associated lipoprotein
VNKKESFSMVTNRKVGAALRLALIAAAVVSVSACATKKPVYAPTTPPPPAPEAPPAPPPPIAQTPLPAGPVAGSEQDFVVNVGDRVYFDYDSYAVRADAQPLLAAQAAWLKRYSSVQVRIEGNCDERGTQEYNLALGARRANSVRDFLVAHGLEASRISTVSYGKEKPIDPGAGEDANQKNRNAHTTIVSGARMR